VGLRGGFGIATTGGKRKPVAGLLAMATYAAALISLWFVVL
jgi:hypothetical protein